MHSIYLQYFLVILKNALELLENLMRNITDSRVWTINKNDCMEFVLTYLRLQSDMEDL